MTPTTESTTPTTATRQDIFDQVEADVVAGFEKNLKKVCFEPVGPFAQQATLVDGGFAAVQWRFVGVDCEDGFSMWNTGKPIEVLGVTVVDMTNDEWLYHRHIDWNAVNSQLGGSRGRSAVTAAQAKDPKAAKAVARECYAAEIANLSVHEEAQVDSPSVSDE